MGRCAALCDHRGPGKHRAKGHAKRGRRLSPWTSEPLVPARLPRPAERGQRRREASPGPSQVPGRAQAGSARPPPAPPPRGTGRGVDDTARCALTFPRSEGAVHGQRREGHGPQRELRVREAARGRRQDARVLRALQGGHGDGAHGGCNTGQRVNSRARGRQRGGETVACLHGAAPRGPLAALTSRPRPARA